MDGAQLEEGRDPQGERVFHIVATAASTASWRTTVKLRRGYYRFEASARVAKVEPLKDDRGVGAGLRLSGNYTRANQLRGSADWTPLQHEFDVVEPERELILVAELRATRGQVDFNAESFKVVQIQP